MKHVEIDAGLFSSAERIASDDHTTVDALVAEGLRRVIEERKTVEFSSSVLALHFGGENWHNVKECVYGPFDD
ncbi:MAG: hypothetical protein ACFB9M_14465 [Myxococcota bacterium]